MLPILTWLGFGGRTGRLGFLGLNILGGAVGGAILFASVLWAQSGGGVAAAICEVSGAAGLLWVGAVLTVRRLHDIGLSGIHAIWILLLTNGNSFAGKVSFTLWADLCAVNAAVFLWLLLRRGAAGANAYGLPPGTPPASDDAIA